MERFVAFVFSLLLMIPLGLFSGMVFADMWGWFITPVFPELPTITTIQAWGIILVTSLLRISVTGSMSYAKLCKLYPEESDKYDSVSAQLVSAFTVLFAWGVSAFIKFVVM